MINFHRLKEFSEIWKKEAELLFEHIKEKISDAAAYGKHEIRFNYSVYSDYAVLTCITRLYADGYKLDEDASKDIFIIRW